MPCITSGCGITGRPPGPRGRAQAPRKQWHWEFGTATVYMPPSLLSLHGLTPSSLLLQTPPPALNPDLGIPLPHMSHGHHKSPALSPPLRLALASAPVLGRNGVTWDSCVFHCSEVTWGSGQIKAPPTDTALCVHASVYPCRSLWSKCQAVLSLGTGQLWVASVFPHIIL